MDAVKQLNACERKVSFPPPLVSACVMLVRTYIASYSNNRYNARLSNELTFDHSQVSKLKLKACLYAALKMILDRKRFVANRFS